MTAKMNPEVKAMWVAALRSGEYKQGYNQLQKRDRFCCLGVLCDIARKNGIEVEMDGERISGARVGPHCQRHVWLWAGADAMSETVEIGVIRRDLASHNDWGVTFAEIADAIEEQL